jgi:hypothetical protein
MSVTSATLQATKHATKFVCWDEYRYYCERLYDTKQYTGWIISDKVLHSFEKRGNRTTPTLALGQWRRFLSLPTSMVNAAQKPKW